MNCKELKFNKYSSPDSKLFTLLYIGGMKKRRFFPEIIDIVGNLDDVNLLLAGKKEDLYIEMEEYSKKYSNVKFLGTIHTDEILQLTHKSNATFIIVDPTSKHYQNTLYNKQFESMVCGRPIIVTKDTYAAELTEKLNCGITVNYEEESVKKAIITLRDNPDICKKLGMNAFKSAEEKYNWNNEKNELLNIYEELS